MALSCGSFFNQWLMFWSSFSQIEMAFACSKYFCFKHCKEIELLKVEAKEHALQKKENMNKQVCWCCDWRIDPKKLCEGKNKVACFKKEKQQLNCNPRNVSMKDWEEIGEQEEANWELLRKVDAAQEKTFSTKYQGTKITKSLACSNTWLHYEST